MNPVKLGAQRDRDALLNTLSSHGCPKVSLDDINNALISLQGKINQLRRQTQELSSKDKTKEKIVYTARFDGLVDIVEFEEKPAFLIKKEDSFEIVHNVEKDGEIQSPPPKENIPWLLPRAEEILKHHKIYQSLDPDKQKLMDCALFEDLVSYHKGISKLPSENHYLLLAAYGLHTYLLEQAEYTPEICFFAVPERGKSRTGKGMINVAYRGIHVESLRDAYILRVANDLNASLFFDVRDFWNKTEKSGSDDIILGRFERGQTVPRVLWPEKGPHQDTKYYAIFGPTIIATNVELNHILETRCIQTTMPHSAKRYEEDVTKEMGLPYKERLVEFRLRHLNTTLPQVNKPCRGRLGDICKPLMQIVLLVVPNRAKELQALIEQIEIERKGDRSESLEAQIIQAVDYLDPDQEDNLLSVEEITAYLNENKENDKFKYSNKRIGKRLSALGFDRVRLRSDGKRAIKYDKNKIDQLKYEYGVGKNVRNVKSSEGQEIMDPTTDGKTVDLQGALEL